MLNRILFYQLVTNRKAFMTLVHLILSKSNSAANRIKEILSQKQDAAVIGLKISLSKKGCNGLSYNMEYVTKEKINTFDQVIQMEDFKVIVDKKAVMVLIGTHMDYKQDQIGSQFVFENPNEKGRCGCGESFHL